MTLHKTKKTWCHGIGSSTQEFVICACFNDDFDITSDFLLSKLFSFSSNILSFSFKQREHLFHWGLYALKRFFTAMLHLGWNFILLSSSTRRIVSYGFYVDWCWRLFSGLRIIFECVFINSFVVSGYVILFVTSYWDYIQDVF